MNSTFQYRGDVIINAAKTTGRKLLTIGLGVSWAIGWTAVFLIAAIQTRNYDIAFGLVVAILMQGYCVHYCLTNWWRLRRSYRRPSIAA